MYSNISDPSIIMITSTFNNSAVILLLGVGVLRYAVKLLVLLHKRDESAECVTPTGWEMFSTHESWNVWASCRELWERCRELRERCKSFVELWELFRVERVERALRELREFFESFKHFVREFLQWFTPRWRPLTLFPMGYFGSHIPHGGGQNCPNSKMVTVDSLDHFKLCSLMEEIFKEYSEQAFNGINTRFGNQK